LRARGLRVGGDGSGIVPLIVGATAAAVALTDALLARGVFVQAIRPPTVPEGTSRLRITPIATHSAADVNALLVALEETLDGRAPGANGPIAGGTAKGGRARAASHRRGTGA
ncbi:MAG: aminotransferase class I/II-fold pyridoxal phosphate-dependent enzyme, partial [Myxococcales bacterium]|nr:aminotransferase class I/II-fold pyridoxal phosphate-dependent enzyme [Myxococcales bacterium]